MNVSYHRKWDITGLVKRSEIRDDLTLNDISMFKNSSYIFK